MLWSCGNKITINFFYYCDYILTVLSFSVEHKTLTVVNAYQPVVKTYNYCSDNKCKVVNYCTLLIVEVVVITIYISKYPGSYKVVITTF